MYHSRGIVHETVSVTSVLPQEVNEGRDGTS